MLHRSKAVITLTIASGASVSDTFDFSTYAGGHIIMPATWTAASIGFKVCDTATGTFLPLYDKDAALVQISSPAVDKAYSLPADLFGAVFVQLFSQDGAGSATNQGGDRSVKIVLKS